MQKSLISTISDRYRQQDFDSINSKDDLRPADIRRLCLELGIAIIAAYFLQKFCVIVSVYIIRAILSAGISSDTTAFAFLKYLLSSISSYLPKICVFAVLYHKYKPLKRLDTQYENKSYYPLVIIPAMFAFAMWGSNITKVINYVLQAFFGAGAISNVMEGMAPQGIADGIVILLFSSVVAPVFEEYIYRHLLLRPLKIIGDTPAIILSALIFGLVHGNFDQFAYAFLSGIILGLIAVRYDSIIPSIILHLINNFFVSIVTYQSRLTGGGELWDSIVNVAATFGKFIINISYYAAPFVAVFLAFCGMAKLTPIGGEQKYKKMLAVFSPVLIISFAVLLLQF